MNTTTITSKATTKRSLLRRNRRRGAAAVEAAFCIPMLFIVMFGTLETCSGIFLAEAIKVSCYEGCRVGVRRRATRDDVIDQVNNVLDARGITGATISVGPETFAGMDALDPITVHITAPTAGNSLYIFDFFAGRSISAEVSMVKEFDEDEEDEE